MSSIAILISGIFGLFFGSFATVLVSRWHHKEGGIIGGRSYCPHCKHTLSWYELLPLFSYLFQKGKCRHCKKSISISYPLSEILFGIIFGLIAYAHLQIQGELFTPSHVILTALAFITGVYVLSDIRYMEIPDEVLVPGIFLYGGLFLIVYLVPGWEYIFFDRGSYSDTYKLFFWDHILAAIFLYTFFYLQIFLPATWQLSKKGKWKDIFELLVSYITFPLTLLIGGAHREGTEDDDSIVTGVGGGDLRVAIFLGLTLGLIHSVIALFIAYVLGSIIGVIILGVRRKKGEMIAFGPFLALGWIISIVFHGEILAWFLDYTLYL